MNNLHAQQLQTIPSLDGIRTISILLVILAHVGFEKFVPGGFGVTVFFFLSGYLISTLLFAESKRSGRIDIPNFYVRRAFRLMPPLLITLAIAYGLTFAGLLPGGITIEGLISQIFYFANYYALFFDPGNTTPYGLAPLWSLAVEEHFYIFFPLFIVLLLGRAVQPRQIAILLGLICLFILVWRIYLVQLPGFVPDRTFKASDTRIDSIIYGCILAIVKNPAADVNRAGTMSPKDWAIFSIAVAFLLATFVYRDAVFRETIRYSIQGIALMPIFYFAIRYSSNRLFCHLNFWWITKIGVYSYSIYLIHSVIIQLIIAHFPMISANAFALFIVCIAISIAYAAAIDRFVDQYFRLLRHRLRPNVLKARDMV